MLTFENIMVSRGKLYVSTNYCVLFSQNQAYIAPHQKLNICYFLNENPPVLHSENVKNWKKNVAINFQVKNASVLFTAVPNIKQNIDFYCLPDK